MEARQLASIFTIDGNTLLHHGVHASGEQTLRSSDAHFGRESGQNSTDVAISERFVTVFNVERN